MLRHEHLDIRNEVSALIEQIAVNGLLVGLIYVIMALGFTMIFGIMRIVNFAHGEFYMIGAVAVLILFGRVGLPFFVAVAVGGLATAAIGILVERFFFRRLVGEEMPAMIMALAIGILLQSLVLMALGPAQQTVPRPFPGAWKLLGATIPLDRTVVGISALAILSAFYAFLKYSRLGLAMRAIAQDREASALMGVESGAIYAAGFGISTLLAGLAGGLMAPIYAIGPYMGESVMLKAFVVVVLGGLGSIPGALLGGLLLGVSESLVFNLFSTGGTLIATFVGVLLIVLVRPTGLMGRRVG
jgi:branched-chain amino acid transport system permease protein